LIRSEAIKLLDEIATHKPELLERAIAINLDTKDNQNCRIVIRANLAEKERDILLAAFGVRKLEMFEQTSGVWVIC